ncbi:hypothetical protein BKA83DRAFT_4129218 [Pisolithus microcarpus]|nr:hypothetical protein BKA83DRAFT_4129218 [Pisolithus microcarpus]
MESCNIPVHSWVCILFGTFKNDIAYVLSIKDSLVETLIVPQLLPYYSDMHSPVDGHSLFDVELAREHGFEVTMSTNDQGHPIAYCDGSEYHFGCCQIYFPKKWVKVVGVPSPDKVAWFAKASIDPSLIQEGDTSRICLGEFSNKLACIVSMDLQCKSVTVHVLTDNSSDDLGSLEISIHDFKLEFPIGTSVKVITGLDCGFQGMGSDQQVKVLGMFLALYISPITYTSQANDQVWYDPLANKNHLQPGDVVHVTRGPHKGLCGMLHYYSGHELLVTWSVIQEKNTADPGDKGKSKAEEADARGDSNVDEDDDLIQISICMDDAIVIPPNTLQFSKERGYNVTVGDHLGILQCCQKMDHGMMFQLECQVSHKVWIISGPSKGYRGMLQLVGNTTCQVMVPSGIMQLKHTAVVTEHHSYGLHLLLATLPLPLPHPLQILQQNQAPAHWLTTPGSSTLMMSPHDAPTRLSNSKSIMLDKGVAWPPPPVMLSTNIKHHFIPACDLTPAKPMSAGQSCLILQGKLTGQIHLVKKCQSKKAPKGVELEDGTKLLFRDICQVIPVDP